MAWRRRESTLDTGGSMSFDGILARGECAPRALAHSGSLWR
jgi:hypothetical protein